jgi:hypothetical protein
VIAAATEIENGKNQRTKLLLLLLARIELGDESASLHLKQTNRKNVQSAKSSKKESKQRNKETKNVVVALCTLRRSSLAPPLCFTVQDNAKDSESITHHSYH